MDIEIQGPSTTILVRKYGVHLCGVLNALPGTTVTHTVVRDVAGALQRANLYRDAGMALIDIGAQSSRYDSRLVGEAEEIHVLRPMVEALVADDFVVSVETAIPGVAEMAIECGASMLNTTAGLSDRRMCDVIVRNDVPCAVTYVEGGSPRATTSYQSSDDKASLVAAVLEGTVRQLESMGITQVFIDPGIGISYRSDYAEYTRQQLQILRNLEALRRVDRPIFVTVPRKRSLEFTLALATLALENGANLVRCHDLEVARIAQSFELI